MRKWCSVLEADGRVLAAVVVPAAGILARRVVARGAREECAWAAKVKERAWLRRRHPAKPQCNCALFVAVRQRKLLILSGGSLGSRVDEERRERRYSMRHADSLSIRHSNAHCGNGTYPVATSV